MKKRAMSTRIGAVLLAASMVVGDAVPTLAAQNTGIETHVSEAEMLGTGVSGTGQRAGGAFHAGMPPRYPCGADDCRSGRKRPDWCRASGTGALFPKSECAAGVKRRGQKGA